MEQPWTEDSGIKDSQMWIVTAEDSMNLEHMVREGGPWELCLKMESPMPGYFLFEFKVQIKFYFVLQKNSTEFDCKIIERKIKYIYLHAIYMMIFLCICPIFVYSLYKFPSMSLFLWLLFLQIRV